MELNAEQLMKALECCITQGAECRKCPFMHTQDLCYREIKRKALALIKQLIEENEDLKAIAEQYQKQFEEAKADTAREMQSEIKDRCIKGGIYPAFVARTIDQIAKEMLEGKQ